MRIVAVRATPSTALQVKSTGRKAGLQIRKCGVVHTSRKDATTARPAWSIGSKHGVWGRSIGAVKLRTSPALIAKQSTFPAG